MNTWFLTLIGCVLAASSALSRAQLKDWQAGVVLDTAVTSRQPELAARDKGWGAGHSDMLLRGPLGEHLSAELIGAFHTVDQRLETHWENAWVQTRRLPAGWQIRAGRFASQIGYWNEIHPHADDFVERGLIQRAFMGSHWVDDGVRINWTAPTPYYLRLGAEFLGGRKWVPQASNGGSTQTYSLKVGNDWGPEHSWQWGLSYLSNRRDPVLEEHDHAQPHAHNHGARYSARDLWISDLVWKWAPGGNPEHQQVRLVWEWAQARRALASANLNMGHGGQSVGLVWRFTRGWETGIRHDRLRVHAIALHAGEPEANPGRLQETSVMLAHKPGHRQTWRVQWSQQRAQNPGAEAVFLRPQGHSVALQYILSIGAHGAHSY
ncbi:MAG: hypothetical protein RL657_2043 [Pseudomonadota bacterium]|jgi:hypothetical protein